MVKRQHYGGWKLPSREVWSRFLPFCLIFPVFLSHFSPSFPIESLSHAVVGGGGPGQGKGEERKVCFSGVDNIPRAWIFLLIEQPQHELLIIILVQSRYTLQKEETLSHDRLDWRWEQLAFLSVPFMSGRNFTVIFFWATYVNHVSLPCSPARRQRHLMS